MNGSQNTPTAAQMMRFTRAIDGRVLGRQSPDYDLVRRSLVWNGRPPERSPLLIVEARSDADVATTVDFAQRHILSVSARGTGHSYSAIFLCDGGVLLDLSRLNDVAVDRVSRRVSVGPAATSGQICAALEREGMAFPVGHDASVGIGGFLLGGGLGVNSAAWGGMSTFNILAADVVTADGVSRRVSADENADLFWALRGGGPGLPFIVTRFHLRCYDYPGAITSKTYVFRFSDLPRLAKALEEIAPALDRRLQVMLAAVAAPPGLAETCTAEDHGRIAALTAIAFADDAPAARSMQAQLAALPILANALAPTDDQAITFAQVLEQGKDLLVSKRYRTDNVLCDAIGDAAEVIMRHLPAAPSPAALSLIVWRGQQAQPDAAYSVSGRYFVSTYAQWDLVGDDAINATWLRRFYDDMAGIATGAYVNEFDLEGRLGEVGRCYAAIALDRLRTLRRQHDPRGVFHNPFSHLHP
ncbi:FAD-binding oxidoreductase [Ensifer sp. ZNC0028]|uniref:FAD-binding oxidoreductase n=1 Tax=Ensifer sp. ZNC0028 TaxID=1339236 RepID=UPI0018CCFFF8|nr:FAD-binding oxidoreductase [Ensifer sp. ZNC0028]